VDASPLDHEFVEVFRLAALQAGAVARHLQGKVCAETKGGGTPEAEALTAVDLAAQDVLLHLLRARMPQVAVDAEEDTALVSGFPRATPGGPLVVLDPVDGTLNYIRGSRDYAVMGSLLQEGRYTSAVVHFPAHGTTYWAVRGEGCHAVDADGTEDRCTAAGAADRIFHTPRTPAAWRAQIGAHTGDVRLCRCSAVDGSAPATGRARAAVAEGRADRRRAIALFLSLEAGATVRMGSRIWEGEDPQSLPAGLAPTVVADTAERAEALAKALTAA
jgi:fructose-1,6-bisphosphatase/inositol monophosphatase family enzyme